MKFSCSADLIEVCNFVVPALCGIECACRIGMNNMHSVSVKRTLGTGRKLNVHKTFRRRPGRLLNVLYMFNLRYVSRGAW